MSAAGKPEARAEGMRIRFRWSLAYSLSSRFGLPSNRARRSETAAARGTQRPKAAPRARRAPGVPRIDASSSRHVAARKAAARPSGEPLAFAATAQACGGQGWRSLSRRRIPAGLLRLTRGSPGGRAIAGRGTPCLCLRPAKPAGARDGPAGVKLPHSSGSGRPLVSGAKGSTASPSRNTRHISSPAGRIGSAAPANTEPDNCPSRNGPLAAANRPTL